MQTSPNTALFGLLLIIRDRRFFKNLSNYVRLKVVRIGSCLDSFFSRESRKSGGYIEELLRSRKRTNGFSSNIVKNTTLLSLMP